jgi:hypothetical protein
VFHNATHLGRGLSSGTVAERIAPESLTPTNSGFVHRNISRDALVTALDQALGGSTRQGLAANSLKFWAGRSRIRSGEESSQESRSRALSLPSPLRGGVGGGGPHEQSRLRRAGYGRQSRCGHPSPQPSPARGEGAIELSPGSCAKGQFVFATRGGVAVVMNWVASSIAVPSGVGMIMRNGTRMRVPASGAKAISMLRWAARYLITARSGM